jgi:hypothetical protein
MSRRAHVFCQARCSSRQFVNSGGTTGNVYGPVEELRSKDAAPPAALKTSSRFFSFISSRFIALFSLSAPSAHLTLSPDFQLLHYSPGTRASGIAAKNLTRVGFAIRQLFVPLLPLDDRRVFI